jgi:hypothetical protein
MTKPENKQIILSSVFILMLIFISNQADSQSNTWSKVYGGPNPEFGKESIQTSDGGFIVLVTEVDFGGSNYKTKLLKVDNIGQLIWQKGIDSSFEGTSIVQSIDNNFFIAGRGNGFAGLIKTDNNGNVLFKRMYQFSAFFTRIRNASDNGLLLCGYVGSSYRAYLIKTDLNGLQEWQSNIIGLPAIVYDVCETPTAYCVTGAITLNGVTRLLLSRLTKSGDTVWVKTFGGSGSEEWGTRILYSHEGTFSIGGTKQISQITKASFNICDTNGVRLNQQLYSGIFSVTDMTNANNGFALVGRSSVVLEKIQFVKIDFNGIARVNLTMNSSSSTADYCRSIERTSDGGFLVGGFTGPESNTDVLLIRSDSMGSAPIGINEYLTETPSDFLLFQNYPNPFNGTTIVKFDLTQSGNSTLKIYDVSGKFIKLVLNRYLNSGQHSVRIDLDNLPSGIYFYELASSNLSTTKSMILVK